MRKELNVLKNGSKDMRKEKEDAQSRQTGLDQSPDATD
jgi:hypothetical protein